MTPAPARAPAVVLRPGRTSDRGSATVLVLGVAGLLVTVTAGMLAVAGTLAARQRADSAADLAALAAARAAAPGLTAGPGEPGCALADRVAAAAHARVVACAAARSSTRPGVTVVVEVPVPRVLAVLDVPPARARARAGVPP